MIIKINTTEFEDKLTDDQLSDITGTLKFFCQRAFEKYAKGAIEHGGNIWQLSEDELDEEVMNEATDQVIYQATKLRKKYGR